ncbi:MAG: polysaccharide deacetylase family protein [Pedobacter sp.]|nr:MAG: polysaccharide deacetylase family protein [Pedobacter sp.]
MYLVKSPLLLKWFYSALTWNKSRSEKIIYLTFDDGPIPNVTDFVLNTLKTFNVKATFFCIGDNIIKHPEVFERVKNEGHAIGNHTFNHLNGWETDDETYVRNILKCQDLTQTPIFRPPFGRIKKSQIRKLKAQSEKLKVKSTLQIIMWDVLSADFDTKISPETCYQNVIKNSENGSIIVFHDSLKAFDRLQHSLPKTIKYLIEKGYRFGTL